MKRKNTIFWAVYAGFVLVLIAALIAGAGLLVSWLDSFEQSQPVHSAEAVFNEYFVSEKWSEVLKLSGYEKGPLESEGEAENALVSLKKDKVMSFYSAGVANGVAKYNVVLIDSKDLAAATGTGEAVKDATAELGVKGIPSTKIATITVTKSKEKGKWNFYGYEFTSLEIFLEKKESAQVRIPSTYTLYVGEQEIGADQIAELTPHEWNERLPDGVTGVEFATYRFEGLLAQPNFSVKDAQGNEIVLTQNEENGVLEAGIVYESDVDEELAKRLLTGLEEYAAYIQNDGSLGRVARYFDTKSDFYKSTAQNLSMYVWDHNGYEFKNEVVEDFYFFDENTLCCRISFDQILKLTGRENYVDNISMIVYARKTGGTWRIFDCVNTGE